MAKSNKIGWKDSDIGCPFYISEDRAGKSLRCEGYQEDMDTVSVFRTYALKDRHIGSYCAGRYERCPVYRCTYGCKYAD